MDLNQFAELTTAEGPQSAMLFGPPRAGKTTLAAQLARQYNVLWIDIEKGAQTLLSAVPREFWHRFHIIQVDDTQDNPNAIKTVGKLFCTPAKHKVCSAHGVIGCMDCVKNKAAMEEFNLYELDTSWVVVVDSVTQLSDSALAHSLGKVDWDDKKKAEFDNWDRQGLLLKNILTSQKRLRCHRVFISHEEELEQEDGTKLLTPKAGTRNFSRMVGRYFDHLIYVHIKNNKHTATSSSTAHPKYLTGSRNNVKLEAGDDICNLFKAKIQPFDAKVAIESAPSAGMEKNSEPAAKPATPNALLAKMGQQPKA